MSEPFLGEIRLMSFGFPPKGWAQCNGQLLPINANQALFSLLGTMYGGDGRVNFALPDLRSRIPVSTDFGEYPIAMRAGSEAVTLQPQEVPQHFHQFNATSADGDDVYPGTLASAPNLYGPANNLTPIGTDENRISITPAPSGPHANVMPYLVVEFCIALQGIFPSPN